MDGNVSYGRGESGRMAIPDLGRGESGRMAIPDFGRGESGRIAMPDFGLGESGRMAMPDFPEEELPANEIAMLVAMTRITVMTRDRKRFQFLERIAAVVIESSCNDL